MARSLLIFCFLALPVLTARAQTRQALIGQIRKARSDTDRIKLQLKLADDFIHANSGLKAIDSAFKMADQALQLSTKIHSEKWQNEATLLKGNYYLGMDDIKKGSRYYEQVINNYHKQSKMWEEARTWHRLGDSIHMIKIENIPYKIKCYESAKSLLNQLNLQSEAIGVTVKIAEAHLNASQFDLAQQEANEALKQYRLIGYKKLYDVYDLLAQIALYKGDYNKRLYYLLEIVKTMPSPSPDVYFNLSQVYGLLHVFDKSVFWAKEGLKVAKAEKNKDIYYSITVLGVRSMLLEKKPEEALAFLKKATQDVPPQTPNQQRDFYENFGVCYRHLKQYSQAEACYEKLDQLFARDFKEDRQTTHNIFLGNIISHEWVMADFYSSIGKYKRAKYFMEKIDSLRKLGHFPPITMSAVNLLAFKVDSGLGNYLAAIKDMELFNQIHDSTFNAANSKQLSELNVKYETGQKEKNIALLKSQQAVQESKLKQVSWQRNVTFGGVAVFTLISALVYIGYRNKQRSNKLLKSKQEEINLQNDILNSLVSEKDQLLKEKDKLLADKDWLLKEVHHRVKNNLHIVMSLLSTQSSYLENNAAIEAIRDSQNRVQAISLLHQKLYSSTNVAAIDMPSYVSDMINYLRNCLDTGRRGIRFEQLIDPINIDLAQAVPLGLILNEAITNAIKYAFDEKGGEIIVGLQLEEEEMAILTIADNGKGLPPDFELADATSLGMAMMKALSRQIRGSFQIKNETGVSITIEFKVAPALINIADGNMINDRYHD